MNSQTENQLNLSRHFDKKNIRKRSSFMLREVGGRRRQIISGVDTMDIINKMEFFYTYNELIKMHKSQKMKSQPARIKFHYAKWY